jgi:cytochrome bd-type quinol oxidase subunit 2
VKDSILKLSQMFHEWYQQIDTISLIKNESLPLNLTRINSEAIGRYFKAVLLTCVSCLIICSNLLNILVIQKTLQLPRITRICILNMSVSDLLVGLISCFPCIIPAFTGVWPYGEIWCQCLHYTGNIKNPALLAKERKM